MKRKYYILILSVILFGCHADKSSYNGTLGLIGGNESSFEGEVFWKKVGRKIISKLRKLKQLNQIK